MDLRMVVVTNVEIFHCQQKIFNKYKYNSVV